MATGDRSRTSQRLQEPALPDLVDLRMMPDDLDLDAQALLGLRSLSGTFDYRQLLAPLKDPFPTTHHSLTPFASVALPALDTTPTQGRQLSPRQRLAATSKYKGSPGTWDSTEPQDLHLADEGSNDDSANPPSKHSSRSRKMKRNPRQQHQNKQAQRRYRERRKQHLHGMEQAVDELSCKLRELAQVESQNQQLQRQARELQQRLVDRELEMASVRQQLQICCPGSGPSSPSTPAQKACGDAFAARVAQLRGYLTSQGLWDTSPHGHGVDAAKLREVADLVQRAYSSCHEAIGAEGVRVSQLMMADAEASQAHEGAASSWDAILQALQLTQEQGLQIAALRRNHLTSAKGLFQERQDISLRAMALMVPLKPEADQAGQPKVKIENWGAEKESCPEWAGSSAGGQDMQRALTDLKANVAQEQHSFRMLSYMIIHHILHPIQAAVYLVMTFPQRCACLSLANAVALSQDSTQARSDNSDQAMLLREPLALGQNLGSHSAGPALLPAGSSAEPLALPQDADMASQSSLTLFLLDTLGPGIAEPAAPPQPMI